MMRLSRSMVCLLLTSFTAALISGCTPTPPPKAQPAPAPVVASPAQAADIQAALVKVLPGAVVGHVSGISGSQAAVFLGSPAPAVHKGDSIQFTDASSMGIANGQVFSIDQTTPDFPMVIVDFEPTPGGRAPVKGDVAIYVPGK